ncbi:MAG TPA: hypothetical protein VGX28_08285 [Frankiaceae bacterium]|jgi:hypothetical protein|nr:hypothetical protein [Frankiaceae bacterium]
MRVLAACTSGAGHLGPMLPFLRACEREGVELLLRDDDPAHAGARRVRDEMASLPDPEGWLA